MSIFKMSFLDYNQLGLGMGTKFLRSLVWWVGLPLNLSLFFFSVLLPWRLQNAQVSSWRALSPFPRSSSLLQLLQQLMSRTGLRVVFGTP